MNLYTISIVVHCDKLTRGYILKFARIHTLSVYNKFTKNYTSFTYYNKIYKNWYIIFVWAPLQHPTCVCIAYLDMGQLIPHTNPESGVIQIHKHMVWDF